MAATLFFAADWAFIMLSGGSPAGWNATALAALGAMAGTTDLLLEGVAALLGAALLTPMIIALVTHRLNWALSVDPASAVVSEPGLTAEATRSK